MNRFRMNLGPAVAAEPKIAPFPSYAKNGVGKFCETTQIYEAPWPPLVKLDASQQKLDLSGLDRGFDPGRALPLPALEISAEEREFIRQVFARTPIQPIAYVGPSEWGAACDRLQEAICKAESIGFTGADIDALTEEIDFTCGEGLDDAANRLNAACMLSVAMPHVTLKAETVREVKPAISGLTTTWGE